jgi:hypothetical protein
MRSFTWKSKINPGNGCLDKGAVHVRKSPSISENLVFSYGLSWTVNVAAFFLSFFHSLFFIFLSSSFSQFYIQKRIWSDPKIWCLARAWVCLKAKSKEKPNSFLVSPNFSTPTATGDHLPTCQIKRQYFFYFVWVNIGVRQLTKILINFLKF